MSWWLWGLWAEMSNGHFAGIVTRYSFPQIAPHHKLLNPNFISGSTLNLIYFFVDKKVAKNQAFLKNG
ncbi:MAG TPA: hypothetical protein PK239_18220 [Chitinophagales bacterium]|nr:hypothetical protein [Chitinophagales bacterium]